MIEHLLELRRRLIFVILFFLMIFVLFFYLSNPIFSYVVSPLTNLLPHHDELIATQITTPILTPLKLAADLALLVTIPCALFHVWRFAAPGLYRHEKKGMGLTILLSITLFFLGALFCFYVVLPFILQFFVHAVPVGVRLMPDITSTVDFITHMMLLFGLCFQVPLVCVLLVKTKTIDIATLRKIRPYWIVMAFILGMLLTPPDVISQITLAIPLCLLYELGIFLTASFDPTAGQR